MSSAKTRLFLTIEKLKNTMDDAQMSYPFWEKFFPLLGGASTVTVDVTTLGELINEAAETAEQLILTQGGVIFSQFQAGGSVAPVPTVTPNLRIINRQQPPDPLTLDVKRYHPYAEKIANHFVSASVGSTVYTVKDVVKLFLYISHVPKYRPLFELLQEALFRKLGECTPVVGGEKGALVLNNLRDLTTITNFRLDHEALSLMNVNVQRALNNELSKYPHIKVREFISGVNLYETEVEPFKAYADKFELLVAQKSTHQVFAADNKLVFNRDPVLVENLATNVEINCDLNRMVYNSMNNIFINAVEQSAAENIKFDVGDYNKRFRTLERVRENSRGAAVEKVAVGDVGIRRRLKTAARTTSRPPISLKKFRTSVDTSAEPL